MLSCGRPVTTTKSKLRALPVMSGWFSLFLHPLPHSQSILLTFTIFTSKNKLNLNKDWLESVGHDCLSYFSLLTSFPSTRPLGGFTKFS